VPGLKLVKRQLNFAQSKWSADISYKTYVCLDFDDEKRIKKSLKIRSVHTINYLLVVSFSASYPTLWL